MKNNIHYLKQSINNPEKLLDESYIFSDWDKNINNRDSRLNLLSLLFFYFLPNSFNQERVAS